MTPKQIQRLPTREACQMCHHARGLGFWVPRSIWEEVVHVHWRHGPLCVGCFARLADEKLVFWDHVVQFQPVSLATHLENRGMDVESL